MSQRQDLLDTYSQPIFMKFSWNAHNTMPFMQMTFFSTLILFRPILVLLTNFFSGMVLHNNPYATY